MADDSVFLSGIVEADETFIVTAGSRKYDDTIDLPPMFVPPVMLVRQARGQGRQA